MKRLVAMNDKTHRSKSFIAYISGVRTTVRPKSPRKTGPPEEDRHETIILGFAGTFLFYLSLRRSNAIKRDAISVGNGYGKEGATRKAPGFMETSPYD